MSNQARKLTTFTLALALMATILTPAAHAASSRLVAQVDEPFEINGTLYSAGKVMVRQLRPYNPTSTLNEVWVGNECLGMLLAERNQGEGELASGAMLFERAQQGHLVLVGFSYRNQPAHEFYRFHLRSSGGRWIAPSTVSDDQNATLIAER